MAATRKHSCLIVVPTGGLVRNEHNQLVPTPVGMMRLVRASELLQSNTPCHLAISGGRRDDPTNSEASVYYRAFVDQWPHIADRVVIVDASGRYTAADMVALASRITAREDVGDDGRFATVVMVSHPNHAHLAIYSLNAGFTRKGDRTFKVEPSGEVAPYGKIVQLVLEWVTDRDPRWEKWVSLPLRCLANRRGGSE